MPHPFVDFLIEREVIPANVAKRLSERFGRLILSPDTAARNL